jgi:glycosyltransferase 2 family protein
MILPKYCTMITSYSCKIVVIVMHHITSRLRAIGSSPHVRGGIGILLSGLTLYLALRNIDYHDVGQMLVQADVLFIGLALFNVAINTVSKAVRWKVLIGQPGRAIPFSNVLAMLIVGQMLNTLFPLRVGDVSRAYVIGGLGPGRVFVLGTVVLEKVLDMITYVLLFCMVLVLIPLPPWVSDSVLTGSLIAVALFVSALLAVRNQKKVVLLLERATVWLPIHVREKTNIRLQSALSSLDVLRSRTDFVWLVIWSLVVWGTAILNNYLTLLALHIALPMPIMASIFVVIILQIGISLPSAPGTIGVFQYGCIVALGFFGVAQSTAFSYGILLHAIVMLPTTLVGIVLFWMMGLSYKQTNDE